MEWCLQCHRNPEKHLRPKSEVFNMAWKADDPAALGEETAERQPHPHPTRADQLLDVPSLVWSTQSASGKALTERVDHNHLRSMTMPVDSEAAPQPLVEQTGRRYRRSLEEFLDTPEFQEMIHREFPEQASEWTDPVTRRRFLMLMGASLALAGLNGCSTQPAPRRRSCPTFGSRNRWCRASRCTSPRPCRWRGWPPAFSSRATRAVRRRSRAIPVIRPASAPPTCSFRRPSSACTIPTVRKP